MAGWGNTKTIDNNNNGPRLEEQMTLLKLPPKKWVTIRFIGPLYTTATAYLNVKKKDGGVSKGFPKNCLDYDPAKQEFTKEICPYRKGGLKFRQRFYSNVIVRSDEKKLKSSERTEDESVPKKMLGEKWYIKDMNSDSATPVQVFSFPTSVFNDIKDIIDADGGELEVNGIENGFDIKIKADPDAANPADKWKVMKGDNTALSKKERKYLIYKLDVSALDPEKPDVAKKEWESIKKRLMIMGEDKKFHPYASANSASSGDLEDDEKPHKKAKRKELSLDSDADSDADEKASKKKSSKADKSSKPSKDKKKDKPSKADKSSKSSKDKSSSKKRKSIDLDSDIPF